MDKNMEIKKCIKKKPATTLVGNYLNVVFLRMREQV